MQLETQRLILREYAMDDFDSLYEIMSDPETMQHYPAPFDEVRTRRWIEWNLENYEKYGWGLWAVVLKETGEFIGDCGITLQNIDGQLLPEIGYHIHKKYWRHGFAKEAARAVRDWVFENTNYDTIYSYMKYTNVASYSTALANGMKKVKEYPDPKNEISYVYAITRNEWNEILKFKRATKDDFEEIFQIYQSAIKKMNEQNIPQWDEFYPDRQTLQEDMQKNQMFIGKKNGPIAVCFVLNEECDEEYKNGKWICPQSHFCVIHRLCVNPDFQNQGIATKTINYIEDFCRFQKYESIRLDCFTQNPYSRRLYDKCGYVITGYADWRKGRFELREKKLFEENHSHLNFLFDLDQTLLNFHASEYIALKIIVTQNGFDFSDELYEYFKTRNKELWLDLEKEKITRNQLFETRFKLLFKKCGADTSKMDLLKINSDFINEMARNGVLMDGALDFVKKLSSQIKNARIYIITNGAVVNAQGRLKSTGLNQYIKETFVSEAMAYSKPAKEYFDIVLNKIAEPKENFIVIGDSLSSDMLGAKNAGLTSCWFMPQGEIEKSMKEYDIDYKADNFEELFEVLKGWAELRYNNL